MVVRVNAAVRRIRIAYSSGNPKIVVGREYLFIYSPMFYIYENKT